MQFLIKKIIQNCKVFELNGKITKGVIRSSNASCHYYFSLFCSHHIIYSYVIYYLNLKKIYAYLLLLYFKYTNSFINSYQKILNSLNKI